MKKAKRKIHLQQAGITLIALVVTIVVLLILAGVSLNAIFGNSGIIQRAKDAQNKMDQAAQNDLDSLNDLSDQMDYLVEGKINWDRILEDANTNPEKYRHEDQSSTNGDIGIGTDGKPVNLDLWKYGIGGSVDNKKITLSGNVNSSGVPGYQNSNITEDGKIIGTVPQYIKLAGKTEFYPIVKMISTFQGCTSLITAPIIPTTVTWMGGTFEDCANLITAPTIPASVTGMVQTFYNCSKLQGTMEINANPTEYDKCFLDAATEGTGLVVTGSSTMLDELINTKSDNSNITKGN